jgi:hypothetical protein
VKLRCSALKRPVQRDCTESQGEHNGAHDGNWKVERIV